MISSVIDNTALDMLVRAHLLQTLRPATYKALVSARHHTSLLLQTSIPSRTEIESSSSPTIRVPASKSSSRLLEINHIQTRAAENNMMLNCSKSKEIIFTARGKRAGKSGQLLTPCLDIKRVSSLRVIGVIVNDQLTATDHVFNILASCNSLLYALRILRSHDIPNTSLHDVFRATVIEKLTYCAPSWSGACSAPDRVKLESFVSRCKRFQYCSSESQHNQRSY